MPRPRGGASATLVLVYFDDEPPLSPPLVAGRFIGVRDPAPVEPSVVVDPGAPVSEPVVPVAEPEVDELVEPLVPF